MNNTLLEKYTSKFKKWILAARLRTLPLSVSGIFVGSFASYGSNDFNCFIFFLALATAIFYQILSNFANDYGDGLKGTDKNRIGPMRALQSGILSIKEMKAGIITISLISLALTISLVSLSFGKDLFSFVLFIVLGLLAITAAIKYTVGKNAYGYSGFGDFFVFFFFGLISVLGSNYLYTSVFDPSLLYPACIIGFLGTGVLNLNNMRDVENDRLMKKNTLPVFWGFNRSKLYHYFLISISIALMLVSAFKENFNSFVLIGLLGINISWLILHVYQVSKVTIPKKFDTFLKPLALATVFYSIILSLHYIEII